MAERYYIKTYKDLCGKNNKVINSGKRERWGIYGSDISSYEDTFDWAGDSPIKDFLYERNERRTSSYAVDIASEGTAIRELAAEGLISGGIAVGLSDIRTEGERLCDMSLNVSVVAGDLLRRSTWIELGRRMMNVRKGSGRGADLIVCRQAGGFDRINFKFKNVFIQRLVSLLNPQGLLIAQTDPFQDEESVKNYVLSGLGDKTIDQFYFNYTYGLYLRLGEGAVSK